MRKTDVYEYQAVTSSGERTSGQLEAADMQDAIAKARAKGLFPTNIRNASRTFPPTDPALRSVQLRLLQASGDGASEVVFDLRPPDGVSVKYCIAGQWHPMVAVSEATAEEVRRALRDLSGLPDLGQATASAEWVANITSALPDMRPVEERMGFHSSVGSPDTIRVAFLEQRPQRTRGSCGCRVRSERPK